MGIRLNAVNAGFGTVIALTGDRQLSQSMIRRAERPFHAIALREWMGPSLTFSPTRAGFLQSHGGWVIKHPDLITKIN